MKAFISERLKSSSVLLAIDRKLTELIMVKIGTMVAPFPTPICMIRIPLTPEKCKAMPWYLPSITNPDQKS